jgi:RNA polymerase sigma-70 factor (ECF subfamily)
VHDIVKNALVDKDEPEFTRRSEGLKVLYAQHFRELCNYIKKHFGPGPPDPEDIAQEAFIRFAALTQHEDIGNARAYLYRAAHNILIDEARKQKVRRAVAGRPKAIEPSDDKTPERILMGEERLAVLAAAIRAMPVTRSRSFLLNRLHGHSAAAIARLTNYSESAVKKHIDLALMDLEAALTAAEQGARDR